jgi:sec-independent protein translocase protein TatB
MPSFSDSVFLFILALLLFGPKKLPVLARELGKWVGEFRRASNEFKMQMEDELRQVEQAERLKKLEAIEAAAPVAPALPGESASSETKATESLSAETPAAETSAVQAMEWNGAEPVGESAAVTEAVAAVNHQPGTEPVESVAGFASEEPAAEAVRKPIAIAGSGEVTIMPPATGLPTARNSSLSGLLRSIPAAAPESTNGAHTAAETVETSAHGD